MCFNRLQIRRVKEETIASGQWPAEPLPGTSKPLQRAESEKKPKVDDADEEEAEEEEEEEEGLC